MSSSPELHVFGVCEEHRDFTQKEPSQLAQVCLCGTVLTCEPPCRPATCYRCWEGESGAPRRCRSLSWMWTSHFSLLWHLLLRDSLLWQEFEGLCSNSSSRSLSASCSLAVRVWLTSLSSWLVEGLFLKSYLQVLYHHWYLSLAFLYCNFLSLIGHHMC